MILFKDVTPRNFLSFGDTPITIRLDRTSTTLITGSNGAGKSSIAEAVCYALFNKSFRGINLPKFVNTTNQKGCLVTLRFEKNGDFYVIQRGQKPAIFTIEKNGEALKEDGASRDFQQVLEEIIGFDYNTFIKTILIGLANYKPFLQLTLPERRAFVDVMLNVSVYTSMATLHKARLSSWKADRQTLDVKLDSSRSMLDSANRSYAKVASMGEEHIKKLEDQFIVACGVHDAIIIPDEMVFEAKYPEAKSHYDTSANHITELNTKLTRFQTMQKSISMAEIRLKESETEYSGIVVPERIAFLPEFPDAKETRLKNVERIGLIQTRQATLKADMRVFSERISFFEKHTSCEVCDQSIKSDHSQEIIARTKASASPLVTEYRELESEKESLTTINSELYDQEKKDSAEQLRITQHNASVDRMDDAKRRAKASVERIESELTALRSGEVLVEDEVRAIIQGYKYDQDDYSAQMEEDQLSKTVVVAKNAERKQTLQKKEYALREVSRIELEITAAKKQDNAASFLQDIEKAKESLSNLESSEKESDTLKRTLDAASELLKDTGIKASVVKIYVPILNNYINEYLENMGAQYKIEMDEEFNDVIKGRYKDEFSYKSLSQGEKQRVDFATTFACTKVAQLCAGIETNLLFLDEIGDSSMDYDGLEAIFQIVERAYGDKNVFFISHRIEMADKCRSVMRLTKHNGFTKIV